MFGNIYGLDLGTYEIKVFDKKQDKICRERDVIAIKNKKNIFAIGDKAYEMYEKAPDDIEVVFPMKSGVIARFDNMQTLLGTLLRTKKVQSGDRNTLLPFLQMLRKLKKKLFATWFCIQRQKQNQSVLSKEDWLMQSV